MKQPDLDSSFEKYRRDRTFRRLQSAGDKDDPKASSVLKQLEAAERSEIRSETLTREVHDFFQDATRTAAGIVQQISDTHEEREERRIHCEIQDFLQDVIRRAEVFMSALQVYKGTGAQQTEIEATIRNIVGPQLDEFRARGTAQLNDKHFGQDPFFQESDDNQGEAASAPQPSRMFPQPKPIEAETPVAHARLPEADAEGWVETEDIESTPGLQSIDPSMPSPLEPAPQDYPEPQDYPAPQDYSEPQDYPAPQAYPAPEPAPLPEPQAAPPEPAAAESAVMPLAGLPKDPAKLRATLKALVKTGVLERDDAQAMYRALMTRK